MSDGTSLSAPFHQESRARAVKSRRYVWAAAVVKSVVGISCADG